VKVLITSLIKVFSFFDSPKKNSEHKYDYAHY
jgi:hypothetical protein